MGNAPSGEDIVRARVAALKGHQEDPTTLWMPEVMGRDSEGCCCCAETIHIEISETLPPELEGVMTYEEYTEIADNMNNLMARTWISPIALCPLVCFSVCVIEGLSCQRKSGYKRFLQELNDKYSSRQVSFIDGTLFEKGVATSRGLVIMSFKSFFVMKWTGPLQAQVEQHVVLGPATGMRPAPYGAPQQYAPQEYPQQGQGYAPQGYPQQGQGYAPPQGYPSPHGYPQGSPQQRPQHPPAIPSPTQVDKL